MEWLITYYYTPGRRYSSVLFGLTLQEAIERFNNNTAHPSTPILVSVTRYPVVLEIRLHAN